VLDAVKIEERAAERHSLNHPEVHFEQKIFGI